MKLTVLGYTQNILSALNSDEVNSITDTTESMQVAEIVRTCFFNIAARAELRDQKKLFQLDASGDSLEPVLMFCPSVCKTVEWIKYYDTTDDLDQYKYVTILPIQQFIDHVGSFDTTADNAGVLSFTQGGETFNFNYTDDAQPKFCTIISNYYVIFDSFDADEDSTLQASKTMCYGLTAPVFTLTDTFVPEIDEAQVPLLLNEAKSLAFFELKQTLHSKAEQEAKRQWNTLQKDKSVDNKPSYFDQLPNFGRMTTSRRGPNIIW